MKKHYFIWFTLVFCLVSPAQADNDLSSLKLNVSDLTQLYQSNNGFVWLKNQQLTVQAHDALEFIANAPLHGFKLSDYHYDLLNHLDPEQSKTQARQFDLLLSDGLLKLTKHVAVGKYNPAELEPDWHIPQEKFNALAFIQQALIEGNLKQQLNSIIPSAIGYQVLGSALARYQTYVDNGGWPLIAEAPLLMVGDKHAIIPSVRSRLNISQSDNLATPSSPNLFDNALANAVKQFQQQHGLKIDGVIGSETRQAMNISAQQRVEQIKLNLERARWLPKDLGQRYVLVNIPNFNLTAVENGQQKLSMKVIVGKKHRPTPIISSQISHLVLHPYWNVPKRLARLDLLPKQQLDPNYFYLKNIRVYQYQHGQRDEVDPYLIDWHELNTRRFPYSLRQDPGEDNALGQMKFFMKNPWDIYLHDTPNKALFDDSKRNYSSGCIRLEHPSALAAFSVSNMMTNSTLAEAIASGKNQWHKLKTPINVYTTYFTVWTDNGGLTFSPDSYNRDKL